MTSRIGAVIIVLAAALSLASCGGEKKEEGKKEAGKDGAPAAAPALPRVDDEQLKPLGVLDIPGFKRTGDGEITMGNVAPRYESEAENAGGAKLSVMTGVGNCVACIENSAAAYKAERDKTPEAMFMNQAMREDPGLVWEFGEMDVDGRKVVTVHILSFVETRTSMGTSRSGAHKYGIHWSDGARQIRVMATVDGGFPKSLDELKGFSLDELKGFMSEEELKNGALTIFKAFAARIK